MRLFSFELRLLVESECYPCGLISSSCKMFQDLIRSLELELLIKFNLYNVIRVNEEGISWQSIEFVADLGSIYTFSKIFFIKFNKKI